MNYKITIQKLESNPNYGEELKKFNDYNRYSTPVGMPSEYFEKNCLHTILTEQEFLDIRNEIIKKFI